ncbi:MAG: type II toxin-antitoxin system VapC family toxin [Gemmatimonadota bacterium]
MEATVSRVFADTSGLYAFLVENDRDHEAAVRAMAELAGERAVLVTTSYVAHESITLLHRRMGLAAIRAWRGRVEAALEMIWIGREVHESALTALVASGRRRVSFTDWTSFEAMRRYRIERAFAFDPDFEREGFETVP